MEAEERNIEARVDRRGLLKALGAAGLGAAFWPGGARAQGIAAEAPEVAEPLAGAGPATSIADWDGRRATLVTGPLTTIAAPAGSRVGVCLLVAGALQGTGPRPVVGALQRASVDVEGLGPFEADPGVEQRVYRLLGALSTPRPVELFGASAAVAGRNGLEAGRSLQITWEVSLRGADVPHATLRGYLDRFHACVVGELAAGSAFAGQLSYVELSRRA